MRFHKHIEPGARDASAGRAEHGSDGQGFPRRHAFMAALDAIASPAFRLHRYRSVHNRLLQDALCELDCSNSGNCGA